MNVNQDRLQRNTSIPIITDLSMIQSNWRYQYRREMQEIVPNVFLGPYAAVNKSKFDTLCQAGITHIVCVRDKDEVNFIRPNWPDHFQYLPLEISNREDQNILQYFPVVNEFIDNCLQNNGRVLIHGNTGVCRSATLTLAYVMSHFKITFLDAFTLVQNKRMCINLSENFCTQLQEYQPLYMSGMDYDHSYETASYAHKRGFMEDNKMPLPESAHPSIHRPDNL